MNKNKEKRINSKKEIRVVSKNLNIKISDKEEKVVKSLRDDHCLNISKFLRLCLMDKFEEMENGKRKKKM